jgi:hypothetical protein
MKGLEDEADVLCPQRRPRCLVEPDDVQRLRADADRAAVGGFEPGDAVQQGALADARFADQGDDFACRDGKARRAEQRPAGPGVTLGEVANGQHRPCRSAMAGSLCSGHVRPVDLAAWQQIVEFLGRTILQAQHTLDGDHSSLARSMR